MQDELHHHHGAASDRAESEYRYEQESANPRGEDRAPDAAKDREPKAKGPTWCAHGVRVYHVDGLINAPVLLEITEHAKRTDVPLDRAEMSITRKDAPGVAGALAKAMGEEIAPTSVLYFSWEIEGHG